MEEVLGILNATQSLAVTVLVWRAIVADRERKEMLAQLMKLEDYLKALLMDVLSKTDLK